MRVSDYISSGATFSPCGTYRYSLTRAWGPRDVGTATCVFIGLNPSTADAHQDDPTIRRCVGFAEREGCRRLVMLNLYGLRSTDPSALRDTVDPIGPGNDREMWAVSSGRLGVVIAAWGAGVLDRQREQDMEQFFGRLWCLGATKDGHPRHPLYLPADAELIYWSASVTGTVNS